MLKNEFVEYRSNIWLYSVLFNNLSTQEENKMNGQFRISFIKKPVWWISVFAVLALVLVGCASTPQSVVPNTGPTAALATSAPAVTAAPTVAPTQAATAASASAGQEATINIATDAKLGKILVDGKGMTLYMFTKDGPDQSNCTGNCLKF